MRPPWLQCSRWHLAQSRELAGCLLFSTSFLPLFSCCWRPFSAFLAPGRPLDIRARLSRIWSRFFHCLSALDAWRSLWRCCPWGQASWVDAWRLGQADTAPRRGLIPAMDRRWGGGPWLKARPLEAACSRSGRMPPSMPIIAPHRWRRMQIAWSCTRAVTRPRAARGASLYAVCGGRSRAWEGFR